MAVDHGALIERLFAALNRQDLALVDEFFTEDVVVDYPQSGEEIRGRPNFRAVLENYPGSIEGESATVRVAAIDELRVVAPLFKVVRVEGAGNAGTYYGRSRYPDGTIWLGRRAVPATGRPDRAFDDLLRTGVRGPGVARTVRHASEA